MPAAPPSLQHQLALSLTHPTFLTTSNLDPSSPPNTHTPPNSIKGTWVGQCGTQVATQGTWVATEDTHRPLFEDSSSSTSSSRHPHPRVSSLWPPRSSLLSPLPLSSAAVVGVYSAPEREERAQRGTMPPFRNTVDPVAEQGSLHGGQPTPLPQTSQPPATRLYTNARISHEHAPTALFPSLDHSFMQSGLFALSRISHHLLFGR